MFYRKNLPGWPFQRGNAYLEFPGKGLQASAE